MIGRPTCKQGLCAQLVTPWQYSLLVADVFTVWTLAQLLSGQWHNYCLDTVTLIVWTPSHLLSGQCHTYCLDTGTLTVWTLAHLLSGHWHIYCLDTGTLTVCTWHTYCLGTAGSLIHMSSPANQCWCSLSVMGWASSSSCWLLLHKTSHCKKTIWARIFSEKSHAGLSALVSKTYCSHVSMYLTSLQIFLLDDRLVSHIILVIAASRVWCKICDSLFFLKNVNIR